MRVLWSHQLPVAPRAFVLAHEAGVSFISTVSGTIYLCTPTDLKPASSPLAESPTALACAEDGSAVMLADSQGKVWILGADLERRLEITVPARVVGLASTVDGRHLAVADATGGLRLYAGATMVWQTTNPRPLQFLAFVPEKQVVVGCADHGLVCCFDQHGGCLWRDGLVANVGSLAVSGDGQTIALACFSSGLLCYSLNRARPEPVWPSPCRLGVLSYSGDQALLVDLEGQLSLRHRAGEVMGVWNPPAPIIGLALTPLAEQALVLTADRRITGLVRKEPLPK